MVKRDINFYMDLDYKIIVNPIPLKDGGGWMAEHPDLKGCCSDGETVEEAIANLKEAKQAWIEVALERNIQIPIPHYKNKDEFSGKFTLRVPKKIHRELALNAEAEGVSLNQYVSTLIAYQLGENSIVEGIREDLRSVHPNISVVIHNQDNKFDVSSIQKLVDETESPLDLNFDRDYRVSLEKILEAKQDE